MSIAVVTDSTSDLPPELASSVNVKVVPLKVRFGDEEFRDGIDLSADDFSGERVDPEYLDLSREQEQMTASYGPRPEVKIEQDKVLWCDLLIFQFPMWWFGMPTASRAGYTTTG